jgi:ketosteroid isomerase-like protein
MSHENAFTVYEGAITRVEFYLDRAEALEAVGLPKT